MKKPQDIQKLDDRIARFKRKESAKTRQQQTDDSEYSRATTGWQISVELLAGVLVGAGMGYVLDQAFSTAPWFLLVFTILGGAAGILNMYRAFNAQKDKE